MYRVLAALLFSTFTFASAHADQWYLSAAETNNLGVATIELPITITAADFLAQEAVVVAAEPILLPEDEALLLTVAETAVVDDMTTGSISRISVLADEHAFLLLEPWAESRSNMEAQLTP